MIYSELSLDSNESSSSSSGKLSSDFIKKVLDITVKRISQKNKHYFNWNLWNILSSVCMFSINKVFYY